MGRAEDRAVDRVRRRLEASGDAARLGPAEVENLLAMVRQLHVPRTRDGGEVMVGSGPREMQSRELLRDAGGRVDVEAEVARAMREMDEQTRVLQVVMTGAPLRDRLLHRAFAMLTRRGASAVTPAERTMTEQHHRAFFTTARDHDPDDSTG